MEIPKSRRIPSRAQTAQLRRLGDINGNSRRAVSALPKRPLSGTLAQKLYFIYLPNYF